MRVFESLFIDKLQFIDAVNLGRIKEKTSSSIL